MKKLLLPRWNTNLLVDDNRHVDVMISILRSYKKTKGEILWGSGSGLVIHNHPDHGASKELMNPLWSRIYQLL